MKRLIQFIGLIFFIALAVILFLPLGTKASEESIVNFEVNAVLNKNGVARVTENIDYDFGDAYHHGIFRDIPVEYSRPDGGSETIGFNLISVTDERGGDYQFELNCASYCDIKIGDPDKTITGRHIYKIVYDISGAVLKTDQGAQFYWNVTGNNWQVPILNTSFDFTLPDFASVSGLDCYTGSYGSTGQDCQADFNLNSATFNSTSLLGNGQGLTVQINFPPAGFSFPGLVKVGSSPSNSSIYLNGQNTGYKTGHIFYVQPGSHTVVVKKLGYESFSNTFNIASFEEVEIGQRMTLTALGAFLQYYLPFIYLLAFWLFIHSYWRRNGKDPKQGTIIAQYEAPAGITPSLAGVIYDGQAQIHDIVAAIFFLAAKGCLEIQKSKEKVLWMDKEVFTLVKKKDYIPEEGFGRFEADVMEKIFAGNVRVELDDFKNHFYKYLPGLKATLFEELKSNGIQEESFIKVRQIYTAVTLVYGAFAIVIGSLVSVWLTSLLYLLVVPLSVIILAIYSHLMPRYTLKGAAIRDEILGLKLFIKVTSQERIKQLYSPEKYINLFETLLPYAMVFGLEKQWTKKFDGLLTSNPSWYTGGDHFSSYVLINSLSSFNRSASYAMAAAPSSSGSGGGGFSGGGFGGGGGGSW